jgi:hypothetical protein
VRSLAHILGSLANRRWRDRDLAHIYRLRGRFRASIITEIALPGDDANVRVIGEKSVDTKSEK